jgi:hypothetical protein
VIRHKRISDFREEEGPKSRERGADSRVSHALERRYFPHVVERERAAHGASVARKAAGRRP